MIKDTYEIERKSDFDLNCINGLIPDPYHIQTDLKFQSDADDEWFGIVMENGEPICRTGAEATKPRAIVKAVKIFVTEVK